MSNGDLIGLPKPPNYPEKKRERRDAPEEAKLLAALGERLCPEGLTYHGSFASHIYQNAITGDYFPASQLADLRNVPDKVANEAVKELARALLIAYGHKPPKKRGESQEI